MDDLYFDTFDRDSDDLVHRLRELEWPAVRPEVRERCWAAFSERLADRDLIGPESDELPRRNVGRRFEFSRRAETGPAPFALASTKPPVWAARPSRKLTFAS